MTARIMLVIPSADMRDGLIRSLRPAGYEIVAFASTTDALGVEPGQCVIVDATEWTRLQPMLHELNRDPMPRILVVDQTDGPVERSRGVDDRLVWPIKASDLLLRIEAQFRMMVQPDRVFRLTDCIVDLARKKVYRPTLSVPLDEIEVHLIEGFVQRPEETMTWGGLQAALRLNRSELEDAVSGLRQKIEANPSDPRHLQTVYGTGLRFVLRPPALTNLHADQTSFVGRKKELRAIDEALAEGRRLVSVTGPPGVGKTRLARQLGLTRSDVVFPGGVWFCDLSEAQYISDVVVAVSLALRVPVGDAATVHDAMSRVGDAVSTRGATLMVLDHVDTIGFKLKGALEPWLARSKELHFLVTSREPLRLGITWDLALGPLEPSDALLLSLQRRGRTKAGIPLGIELGTDDAEGTRAMSDALDASWGRLDPKARRAATLCGVFNQGFSLEAFRAVVGIDDAEDVLKALEAARIVRSFDATTRRWGMSGAVKEHARRQLRTHPEGVEATDRHTAYYLALARAFSAAITQTGGHRSLLELRRERGNLQAVYGRANETDPRAALEVLLAWHADEDERPPADVQLDRLDRVLERASKLPDNLRGYGRVVRAEVRLDKGMIESANEDLDYAKNVAVDQALLHLGAWVLRVRGRSEEAMGRKDAALHSYEECVKITLEDDEDPAIVAERGKALYEQALLQAERHAFDGADSVLYVGQDLLRQLGNTYDLGTLLALSGRIAANRGDHDGALGYLGEALDLFLRFDRRVQQAEVLHDIGLSALAAGRVQEADAPLAQAIYLFRQLGRRGPCALTTGLLGLVRHRQLQFGEALELYDQAIIEAADPARAALFSAYAMACHADLDQMGQAEELHRRLSASRDVLLAPLVDVCESHLVLARSRAALAQADKDTAAWHLDTVMRRVRVAQESHSVAVTLLLRLYEPSFAIGLVRGVLDMQDPP